MTQGRNDTDSSTCIDGIDFIVPSCLVRVGFGPSCPAPIEWSPVTLLMRDNGDQFIDGMD